MASTRGEIRVAGSAGWEGHGMAKSQSRRVKPSQASRLGRAPNAIGVEFSPRPRAIVNSYRPARQHGLARDELHTIPPDTG